MGSEGPMQRLFWLVFKQRSEITVYIQPAGALGAARLRSAIAGVEGEFQEGHELDAKMAGKVPKGQIGKSLTRKEATALLKKLGP
jgi:hypothetical protein